MSAGWKEVARLGDRGERYPHVLVDEHGLCLRMGPRKKDDEKYYSSLPSLLQGVIEHFVRRKLKGGDTLQDLEALVGEVRDALRSAAELCRGACEGGMEARIRHLRARGEPRAALRSRTRSDAAQIA